MENQVDIKTVKIFLATTSYKELALLDAIFSEFRKHSLKGWRRAFRRLEHKLVRSVND